MPYDMLPDKLESNRTVALVIALAGKEKVFHLSVKRVPVLEWHEKLKL